jgi:ribosome-binding protein aMBF1 (putative translation factor)
MHISRAALPMRPDAVCEYGHGWATVPGSKRARMSKSIRTQQNEVFLALLRDRREALGLRQADLAERLGQTQATVSRVETGETRLDIIELRTWLRALNVSFLAFMKQLDTKLDDRAASIGVLGRSSR